MSEKKICKGEQRFSLLVLCLSKFTALGRKVVLVAKVFKLNESSH